MTDPTRLIELEDGTSALERRVLDAARGIAAPPGAKASVLGAIASQAALGASAAAATTSSLSLVVKSVAAGIAIGVAATAGVTTWALPVSPPPAVAPAPSLNVVTPMLPSLDPPQRSTASPLVPLVPAPKVETPSRRPVDKAPSESSELQAPASPSQSAFSDPPIEVAARQVNGASAADGAQLESRRVAEARGLLRAGRAAAALVLLREVSREFPSGVLTQEREALTIEALLGSGDRERARALALSFLTRYPNSPLAGSVRRALD